MRKRRKYYGLDGREEGAATVSRSGYARSRRIKQQSRGVVRCGRNHPHTGPRGPWPPAPRFRSLSPHCPGPPQVARRWLCSIL